MRACMRVCAVGCATPSLRSTLSLEQCGVRGARGFRRKPTKENSLRQQHRGNILRKCCLPSPGRSSTCMQHASRNGPSWHAMMGVSARQSQSSHARMRYTLQRREHAGRPAPAVPQGHTHQGKRVGITRRARRARDIIIIIIMEVCKGWQW